MKLFALKDLSTGRLLPNLFFSTKSAAKSKRDELNGDTVKYCVTYGPEHRKSK